MTEKETLIIDDNWKALSYKKRKVGHAEISKHTYTPGYYLMEGIDGYLYYEVVKPLQITNLKISGDVVMVDDPLHWIGMKRIAEACHGKVLVGGLGLGIILHHLKNNNKVTKIVVCEIDIDVIELISSVIPDDSRVMILCKDVFSVYDESIKSFDVIVLDVCVKAGNDFKKDFPDMNAIRVFKLRHFDKKVYVWGINDNKYNPGYCPSPEIEKRLGLLKAERKKRNYQ